ncbi:hypothetical protein [Cytobacillus praedii]|uniref:hypothetical protein n=1 Tax=Cytobacillus praedii TaxID=1742358 RepID=UPI002E24DEE1|nr:hypothetical protein [Cytobacillus praedii]
MLRSKVVHTGDAEINLSTIEELEIIVSRFITLFSIDERFSSLKTKVELRSLIEQIKFK